MEAEVDNLLKSFHPHTTRLKDVQKHLVRLKPLISKASVDEINALAVYVAQLQTKHALMLFDHMLKLQQFTTSLTKMTVKRCMIAVIEAAGSPKIISVESVDGEQTILFHLQVLCRIGQNLPLPQMNVSHLENDQIRIVSMNLFQRLHSGCLSIDCLLTGSLVLLHVCTWVYGQQGCEQCVESLLQLGHISDDLDPWGIFTAWFGSSSSPSSTAVLISGCKRSLAFCHSLLSFYSLPEGSSAASQTWVSRLSRVARLALANQGNLREESTAVLDLLQMRVLLTWSAVLRDGSRRLSQDTASLNALSQLVGDDSEVMLGVLTHCSNSLEDPVDVIRHGCRETLQHILHTHTLLCANAMQCNGCCPFLIGQFRQITHLSWNQRGKFTLLLTFLDAAPGLVKELLTLERNLPTLLVQLSEENCMAAHTSALYLRAVELHKGVEKQENENANKRMMWWRFWLSPIAQVFTHNSSLDDEDGADLQDEDTNELTDHTNVANNLKTSLTQYFLPKLLRDFDEVAEILLEMSGQIVSLAVCCAKFKLQQQYSRMKSAARIQLHIPDLVMGTAFYHRAFSAWDTACEMEVLALLVEESRVVLAMHRHEENADSTKSILEVTTTHCSSIIHFITHTNTALHSTHWRNLAASFLNKFHQRIVEQIRKRGDISSPPSMSLMDIFLNYVETFARINANHLHPCAAFHRRTVALQQLRDLADLLLANKNSCDGLYEASVRILASVNIVRALLLLLNDTFTGNKANSLRILQFIHMKVPLTKILGEGVVAEVGSLCGRLTVGHRPQDGLVAEYLLQLQSILSPDSMSRELVVEKLLAQLEESLALTENHGLQWISSRRPFYNTLHCLMATLFPPNSSPQQDLVWRSSLQSRILRTCYQISRLVSPIVTHVSPEGLTLLVADEPEEPIDSETPSAGILGPGLCIPETTGLLSSNEGLSTPVQELSLAAEYLVLCCWRSIKGASLLVGRVLQGAGNRDLLALEEVTEAFHYFRELLLSSRHRGAFELASTGFQWMLQALWKNPDPQVNSLPTKWLREVLDDLQCGGLNQVCATRRSAGLPYFILGLLTSAPAAKQSPLISLLMERMLRQTSSQLHLSISEISNTHTSSQELTVHCLNILRVLYRNSHVGDAIGDFVADGVRCCIQGFASDHWAIRNSSTMLFTSLMQRIFGVNRSSQEDTSSRKNKLSGKIYFQRFPQLYAYFMSVLREDVEQLSCYNVSNSTNSTTPRLQPTLLILSRLLPPTNEGVSSQQFSLQSFVPLVMECGRSRVWQTRQLAAHALVAITYRTDSFSHCQCILQRILSENAIPTTNELHGCLLQIRGLLHETLSTSRSKCEMISSINQSQSEFCSQFVSSWLQIHVHLMPRGAVVVSEWLHITRLCFRICPDPLKLALWSSLETGLQRVQREFFFTSPIGATFLYRAWSEMLLQLMEEEDDLLWVWEHVRLVLQGTSPLHESLKEVFCEGFLSRYSSNPSRGRQMTWRSFLWEVILEPSFRATTHKKESLWVVLAPLWTAYLQETPLSINEEETSSLMSELLRQLLTEWIPRVCRVDARAAMIGCVAILVLQLCSRSGLDLDPEWKEEAVALLCGSVGYHNHVAVRVAAAGAILTWRRIVFDPKCFSTNLVLRIFGAWLVSLFDDEVSVRVSAVRMVSSEETLLPVVALQEGTRQLLHRFSNKSLCDDVACPRCQLICQFAIWTLSADFMKIIHPSQDFQGIEEQLMRAIGGDNMESGSDEEVRVFDRDELNICSDDALLLAQIVNVLRCQGREFMEKCSHSPVCFTRHNIAKFVRTLENAVENEVVSEDVGSLLYQGSFSLQSLARQVRIQRCIDLFSFIGDSQ